jgi:hypothetical protein
MAPECGGMRPKRHAAAPSAEWPIGQIKRYFFQINMLNKK